MDIGSILQKDSISVLLCDVNGWWDRLERMFISNSGLVSRNPESCLEEIISYYCPQCLNRYMEDEVNSYRNHCPNCFTCPICECVVSDNSNENDQDDEIKFKFKCNYCSWKGGVKNDAEELQKKAFKELLLSYQEEDALLRNPKRVHTQHLRKQQRDHEGSWRCADIEEAIKIKTSLSFKHKNPQDNSVLYNYLNKTIEDNNHNNNILTWSEPGIANGVLLRTKRTLRSRKEFDQGKMSILVQPKAFPLEGDSSMNLQRGRWFIKDTSAFYSIPRLEVINNNKTNDLNDKDNNKLSLYISNPLEDDILVRLESRTGTTWGGSLKKDDTDTDVKGNHQYLSHLKVSNGKEVNRASILTDSSSSPTIPLKGYEDPLLRDNIGGCVHDQDFIDIGDGFQMKQYENEAILLIPLKVDVDVDDDKSEAEIQTKNGAATRYLISVGLSTKMKTDAEDEEWTTYEVMIFV